MKTQRLRFAAVVAILVMIAGCTGENSPTPTAGSPYPVETSDPGYPAPTSYAGPGYPVEDSFEESFYANLTPIAPPPEVTDELGAFTAILEYAGTDRPVLGQSIFAATKLPVPGIEGAYVPSLDPLNDRNGITDSQGRLVISLVPAGSYALVLVTPMGPILLEQEGSSDAIDFDITAGEVTDFGTVHVLLDPTALEPAPNEP